MNRASVSLFVAAAVAAVAGVGLWSIPAGLVVLAVCLGAAGAALLDVEEKP